MNPERIPCWLLWPLTLPYGAATQLRTSLYHTGILRQKRLGGAVISVGNLTAGGTGKTPMVLWLAERLAAEGKRAAILTRGYKGGRLTAPERTGDRGGYTCSDPSSLVASDEAQLLQARLDDRVEIGVGADRFARGRQLEQRGVSWFLLDDGFQHIQLARDVDIVLIDAMNPFGGPLLPVGRRREPRSSLGRADLIVIMRSAHAPALEAAIRRESNAPIFYARTELQSVRKLSGVRAADEVVDSDGIRRRKLFAFCGIGNPTAFLADLQWWNFEITGRKVFPDHHRYTQGDMNELLREAHEAGAEALVCTEKDTFNLAGVKTGAIEVLYCVISLSVDRADEFWRVVMSTAGEKKAARENRG